MLRRGLAGETAAIGKRRAGRLLLLIISIFSFMVLNMDFSYGDAKAPYDFLTVSGIGAGNPGIPGGSSPTTPSAIDFEGNVVSSGYEFLTWMDRHEASGGRMVLSSDISVYARSIQEYFYPQKKITIDTAGHSITIKRGTFLNINGDYSGGESNAEILGTGGKPLIILEDGGLLSLQRVKMKTAGANSNAIYKKGGEISLHSSSIEVSGQGSAGIISEDSLELENVYISSSGADSSAVRSRGSIYVFFGNLSARGDNSAAAATSGAAITLDTSYADPGADGAAIIDRVIPEDSYYKNIRQQILLNGKPSMPGTASLQLANADDPCDIKEMNVKIQWDTGGLDVTKTGAYEITGRIIPMWDGITIHGDSFLKMKIYVKDPSVPDMSFITITDSAGKYFITEFPQPIDNTEDIVLWRLGDNGQWYDYTENCDFYSYGEMHVNNVESEIPAYFKLEVRGNGAVKGFSDIIKIIIHKDDSYDVHDLGGDRDGGDRDGGEGAGEALRKAAKPAKAENPAGSSKPAKSAFALIYILYGALEKNMAGGYNAIADLGGSEEIYAAEYSRPEDADGPVVNSGSLSPAENTGRKNGNDAAAVERREEAFLEEPSPEEQEILTLDAVEEQNRTKTPLSHGEGTESGYKRDYISMLVMTALLLIGVCFIPAVLKRKWSR